MKIRNKKLLTKSIAMAIFMSSTLYTMPITHAAFNNNTLPSGGSVVAGQVVINDPDKANIINQTSSNAVIQWKDFSIGANATVNFKGPENFNTLNYVNSGNLSQIYGTINADKGNIYIVNPAGVQIGNSAQINVGSLYVSNKNLDTPLENIDKKNPDINSILGNGTASPNAELMSLGNINATNVTFDGNRIVLDVDRVKNGQTQLGADNITIKTTEEDLKNKNVVLGYTAYDDKVDTNSKKIGYEYTNDKNNSRTQLAKLILDDNSTEYITKADGFMWVKDGEQLQAMNSNLSGNYAFRNSIDLNATADPDVKFNSVGLNDKDGFIGTLDGLGYEVYGLYINEASADTGLFAKTDGATIRNFNLISGSITSNAENAGAVVGNANNTVIENVKNTINVTGANNVGGIIGTGTNVTLNGVVNAGAIKGNSNVGGLAGSLTAGSTLKGESYNLGDIKGTVNNIGGLVGSASHSTIGNKTGFQMYNHLDVTGGYNVGGIVGNLEDGSTVQNVYNDGTVKATDKIESEYNYHTGKSSNLPNNATFENGIATVTVDIANVGGIVGNSDGNTKANTINNVLNNGDISSNKQSNNDYYDAGNVGGVVGSAVNTNITDATNKENDIRGAHNVGGIAGYFEEGTISNAINNGGDILATGARHNGDFIKESVRNSENTKEEFNIGNMGGIVGYMFGDGSYVELSSNRGTVHSAEIKKLTESVPEPSKAANTGGIVGKIDRGTTLNLTDINDKDAPKKAAVSNSYNTGNVSGYTGVGGVVGMMYNGEVINSYNLGNIQTTRQVQSNEKIPAVNMGGVVGDTTENSGAQALIYNVYNKGQIGDENFNYYARHVGGVVGRLSGTVEKAYNNGAIYNGYSTVGGVVGWWAAGSVNNVFNTGNITVVNNDTQKDNGRGSEVGGIIGSVNDSVTKLTNAYNLGTLRSFVGTTGANNSLGGIIGNIHDTGNRYSNMEISNVYTLGNLYVDDKGKQNSINSIYGQYEYGNGNAQNKVIRVDINNAYYIQPGNSSFTNLKDANGQHTDTISYDERTDISKYKDLFNGNSDWRMYNEKTTPILNAFMPDAKDYFDNNNVEGINNIQYGTAYDPLLTIINTKNNSDITLDWEALGIYGDAGLAIYGGGLTLDNFKNSDKGVGLFGGIIYSDGALNIKSYDGDENTAENIGLGSFSKLYGSSVTIDAGKTGTVDAYGSIISTGNKTQGDITITGANVNTYGEIKTAVDGQTTTIYGIGSTVDKNYNNKFKVEDVKNQNAEMPDVAEGYAYTTKNEANRNGDISITATDGDVNIYYGNMEKGIIDTQGNVSLSGSNVYVDSDMVIGGNLNATADSTGEIIVDISNIGKVSLKQYTNNLYKALVDNDGNLNNADSIKTIINNLETKIDLNPDQLTAFANYLFNEYIDKTSHKLNSNATESAISDAIIKGRMHNFLKSFSDNKSINFKGTDNAKITVDLWDGSSFNLNKYDQGGNTLSTELSNLNIKDKDDKPLSGKNVTYIWVADGEQLEGIQDYANQNINSKILSYNFALKNDINATDVKDYQAIGSGDTVFTGKFDGRGNRIIGLNVSNSNDNVGVFGVNAGTIKNLKVYSSTFKGYDNVGAIAGTNNGTIDNVTTLGNTVEASGSANSVVGAAGGVVGTNNGAVDNATSRDSVIAGQNSNEVLTIAGGIAGINTGLVSNSQSHSAVIASKTSTYSLGGIVGVNTAKDNTTDNEITAGLDNVNAYGVTGSSILVDNTGGIAGLNSGTLNDAYNESIVKGSSNVGGIAGTNSGNISLIVNGASVTAEGSYTGGLVGSATGTTDAISSISDGRNNGVITGDYYVGGLVGSNSENVELTNLTNDSSAEITGKQYVGGIAGTNSGSISTTDTNLINRGSITGNKYVGGIAGENNGTIENVKNDIVLNAIGSDAMYFGGVTGRNTEKGTITDATNRGNINASGATFVGGIAGQNDGTLSGAGNSNEGKVTGKDYVGGVAGLNTENAKITTKDNIIVIKNEGEVKAEAGGAGGIFGKNEANIQYAEFVNSGKVTGTAGTTGALSGTGGIFGENTGHIDHSSLKNEVKGNVSGVNNVGGLIGINSGNIAGGRGDYKDQKNTYYKYQIYNNGTITATGNGSNIGGLIGKNTGSLTAGYNTGNIVAGNSTNVGGIVGTNEGTVDQVFNTIMTVTGENTNTINGKDNVGAIIGNNTSGTLTNAYSTNGGVSALVGIGNKNSNTEKDQYGNDIWKTYKKDISSANEKSYDVLKVFLTSVKYDPSQKPDLVYNGEDQYLNVDVTKKDSVLNNAFKDLSGKQFLAQENTDNKLIGSNGYKNVGTYTDWLYSGQIASSGAGDTFNPNNLGYDIDLATGIKKAQIDITLNDIERIYGSLDIINNGGYGFTCNNDNLTPAMIEELKSLGFSVDSDSALVGDKTKDVGSYTWTGIVTLGSLSSNYELKNDNDGDGSITSTAISKVTPKTLTLKDLLATIVYGNQDNKGLILQKPNNNTDILNGIVYGDDVNINLGNITLDYKNDSAYDQNKGNRVTADVETYEDSLVVGNISLINNENKNYVLDKTTTGGSIQVTPASLTVGLNNVSHEYGSPELNSYGISSVEGLTNGDEASKDKVYVENIKDSALKDNNMHTNDVGDYNWTGDVSGIKGIGTNYNITFKDGKSEVTPATLTVGLNNVSHVYGSPELNSYGISSIEGLTNGDEASKDKVYVTMTKDNALKDNNKHTNDVGDYTWTGSVSGIEGLEKNYNITFKDGQSEVTPASLTVGLNNVSHVYGSPELNSYGISSIEGLTNGDEASKDKVYVTMTKDNALKDNNKHTNDVGDYTWTGSVSGIEGLEKNYSITVNNGKSTVDKANLTIDLNDVKHTYGSPNLNDYGVSSVTGLTNGDKANIGVTMTEDTALKDNNKHTNDVGDYTWTGSVSGIEGLEKNYSITVNEGQSVVNKADLVIDLGDVEHTYGTPNTDDYEIDKIGWVNGDNYNPDNFIVGNVNDEAIIGKDKTQNANNEKNPNYEWNANVTTSNDTINKNYNIIVNDGKSTVNKADLVVDLNKVYHTYGDPNLKDYGIDKVEGLTNGDKISEDKLAVEMTKDNALKDKEHTNDAGDYTWTGSVDGIEGLEDNYNITINPGKSTVDKGHLTITVDDSNTTVGDNPNYGGTVDGWANGDNPNDFDINFGLDDDTILDQPGKHDGVIGVIIDGTFYPSGTEDDIFNNYDVTISTGDLTVLKPIDINDYKNWSHLYKDAPWDRNRDFKERKAEFNFVDGAIPLDEAVEEA